MRTWLRLNESGDVPSILPRQNQCLPIDPVRHVAVATALDTRSQKVLGWRPSAEKLKWALRAVEVWRHQATGRAPDAARHRGDMIPNALLAHFAPLGWQFLNLAGDYLWGVDASLGPNGLGPLRGTATSLPTVTAA